MLRIIFMGTPDFALPALEAVKNSGQELLAVVTQPTNPGTRKATDPVPGQGMGSRKKDSIFQPQKIRGNLEFLNQIKEMNPDLIVTAAYGQILPGNILAIPPLGCINVHASLLPEYRGHHQFSRH